MRLRIADALDAEQNHTQQNAGGAPMQALPVGEFGLGLAQTLQAVSTMAHSVRNPPYRNIDWYVDARVHHTRQCYGMEDYERYASVSGEYLQIVKLIVFL